MRIGFRILHTNETECSVTDAVKLSLWECSTIFSCLQSLGSVLVSENLPRESLVDVLLCLAHFSLISVFFIFIMIWTCLSVARVTDSHSHVRVRV
jgi:hypothetical protein